MSYFKREPYRNKKILEFAKGQECTMQLPHICNNNPETTVACHIGTEWSGAGMGQKADDCAVVYACSSCHDVMDGRVQLSQFRSDIRRVDLCWYVLRAYYRTIRLLLDNGILK